MKCSVALAILVGLRYAPIRRAARGGAVTTECPDRRERTAASRNRAATTRAEQRRAAELALRRRGNPTRTRGQTVDGNPYQGSVYPLPKQPKLGWLYLLIVLCVAFSGVMMWGLLDKFNKQKESADTYTELSREAVVAGVTVFADETATSATASPGTESEAVDQSDTVFMINNNVITMTAVPSQAALPTVAVPSGVAATATAQPTATGTPKPTPAPTVTVTPMATAAAKTTATTAGTATPRPSTGSGWVLLTPSPTPTVAPKATATPKGTATPKPTTAPSPTHTFLPTVTPTVEPTSTPTATFVATEEPGHNRVVVMDSAHYSVDFGYLQGINPDVKAWLVQDGTVINYPVVQGKDNNTYLDKMFNGKLNKDGSIFLDSGSSEYFGDANSYIYGHHTKTDSMFSTLAKYKEQTYYDAHPQMILLTPYGDYCIDLFASRVAAVDDETTWRVKQFTRKADFSAYIDDLEKNSLFQAEAASMPEWGDQLLVLVTCTNDQHGQRYVVYGRMRQIIYASKDSVTVTKMAMDSAPTIGGWREVPGRGLMMTYAQNDPLWTDMKYESRESNRKRSFGQGGCGPTSVAMAIVNLVPKERLGDIYGYAKSSAGYTFCQCSVNQYFCNKLHAQYQIQQPDEYERYYPLVMASFATGNNLWGQTARGTNAGTNLSFIKKVAWLYKLDLSVTYDTDEALAAVKGGALAIASLGGSNPFTGGGHYVVLAGVDEQNLYVLDPYRKDSYDDTDKQHILNPLSPGVVAVKLENARGLSMSTFYILKKTSMTDSADPPVVQ